MKRKFKPEYSYGNSIMVTQDIETDEELIQLAYEVVTDEILATIPTKHRHKVKIGERQGRPCVEDPLGIRCYVYWRYDP